jgi:phosphomannomutase/phosphoglucomutase
MNSGNQMQDRTGEGEPAVPRNPFSPTRTDAAVAITIAALFAAILIAAVLLQLLVLQPANRGHAESLAESRAGLAAAYIDLVTGEFIERTRRVAADAGVPASDPEARGAAEQALLTALPAALRVRLNRIGEAELALGETPPLSFAGLDLIRRAERGAAAGPELLATDDGPVVNVAVPIPGAGGRPRGTLFVTWPASALREPLSRLPIEEGRFQVRQTYGNSTPVDVIDLGVGTGRQVERPLTAADWSLVFHSAGTDPVATPLGALPGWLLILLLTAGVLVAAHRRLDRALDDDLERLLESARALAAGGEPLTPKQYLLVPAARAGARLRDLADMSRRAPPEPVRPGTRSDAGTQAPEPAADAEEDDELLDIEELGERVRDEPDRDETANEPLPPAGIFRAYDIRGIAGTELTESTARRIGRAAGSEAAAAGDDTLVVARDGRHSSPGLAAALIEGILASGRDVIDIGAVPSPLLYFAIETLGTGSGIMVTGSHNPPEYNGFKVVIGGETLADDRITGLLDRIRDDRLDSGEGRSSEQDVAPAYVARIAEDVALARPLKVVVDCGNGIAGGLMPQILEAIGCEVLPLYCDVDGDFPNHHPDPSDPANLKDLGTIVRAEGADLGIALDGDGDRLGAVDERGAILWPDRLLMLFARDIVGRNPGTDVLFDVKCSRHLNGVIAEYGGRPIMGRTGHSHLKARMKETGALLGGEFSGHICFGERWYGFDDGLYSAARLVEVVGGEAGTTSEIFAGFPDAVSTPEVKVTTTEEAKFAIMDRLTASDAFAGADITSIDGLRIDYPDGWGLVRASNTGPVLTLRFEADDRAALARIGERFRTALQEVDGSLDFSIDQ